jgi:hypothetical protein
MLYISSNIYYAEEFQDTVCSVGDSGKLRGNCPENCPNRPTVLQGGFLSRKLANMHTRPHIWSSIG